MFKKVIWLTGMPRSGTTWISQIFASNPDVRVKFCPLFSYAFKNALNENSTAEEWKNFFMSVDTTKDDYMDQKHLISKGLIPDFTKKNNPQILLIKSNRFHNLTESILNKYSNVIFISIVRDPCATIHSWLSNPLEFPSDQDPLKQWRHGLCRKNGPGEYWGFNDWKKVTLLHLRLAKEWPERFFIHRYEDFLNDPQKHSRELLNRLGIEMAQATIDFIISSQNRHNPHRRSVFKDPSSLANWKNAINPMILKEILNDLKDTELSGFLDD